MHLWIVPVSWSRFCLCVFLLCLPLASNNNARNALPLQLTILRFDMRIVAVAATAAASVLIRGRGPNRILCTANKLKYGRTE